MLTLVTAVPGSGKTLFAVQKILSYQKENQILLSQGNQIRPIYTNIEGLKIDGVLEAPTDWRSCPDGSIVFYDECQQMFPPDRNGRSERGDIADLETHRHRGFDIWMITQHPKLLHSHIRRLVGKHYHLERQFGTEASKVFQKDGQLDVDKPSILKSADHFLWTFPKELYGLYKSAVVHTHKRSLPRWLIRSIVFGTIALIVLFIALKFAWGFFTGDATAKLIQKNVDSSQVQIPHNLPEGTTLQTAQALPTNISLPPINCISSKTQCACYDTNGIKVTQSDEQCRQSISSPPLALISTSTHF